MLSLPTLLTVICTLIIRFTHCNVEFEISDQSFSAFIDKYGDDTLQHSDYPSPAYPLINVLKAVENWGLASDLDLPSASEYPYFRWIPFYGNSSTPSRHFINRHKVTFDPQYCFQSGSMWTEYDAENTSRIVIHMELFNKSSFGCRCLLLFATVNKVIVKEFFDPGPHQIDFPVEWTALSTSDQYDIERRGIRVLTFLGDLAQTVADVTETATLFECLATTRDLKFCESNNIKFMKEYAGIEMTRRSKETNEVWKDINESLIQSGDFFGVIRLDGLDPTLAWAMGSATGHTTIAIRDPKDDKLYIAESTSTTSYWSTNGIQRTEYHEWMKRAKKAGFNVVWEPLNAEMREKFNASAAMAFFETVEGLGYGFPTMLASWIDTREDNYPCLPPDFTKCLTWDVLEVALGLFERLIPGFSALINPGLNKRLNVQNMTLSELYYHAFLEGIESVDLLPMVEQDNWNYAMPTNNGPVKDGLSMVCCMFVCHMWKAGGLFEHLGNENVNCNEFTNFDDYGLTMFDAEFTQNRPDICKTADPNNQLCQMMGDYSLVLDKWNTVKPHKHMMEHCPSRGPDYVRPATC